MSRKTFKMEGVDTKDSFNINILICTIMSGSSPMDIKLGEFHPLVIPPTEVKIPKSKFTTIDPSKFNDKSTFKTPPKRKRKTTVVPPTVELIPDEPPKSKDHPVDKTNLVPKKTSESVTPIVETIIDVEEEIIDIPPIKIDPVSNMNPDQIVEYWNKKLPDLNIAKELQKTAESLNLRNKSESGITDCLIIGSSALKSDDNVACWYHKGEKEDVVRYLHSSITTGAKPIPKGSLLGLIYGGKIQPFLDASNTIENDYYSIFLNHYKSELAVWKKASETSTEAGSYDYPYFITCLPTDKKELTIYRNHSDNPKKSETKVAKVNVDIIYKKDTQQFLLITVLDIEEGDILFLHEQHKKNYTFKEKKKGRRRKTSRLAVIN